VTQDIEAMICWFSERPLASDRKYFLRHTTREVQCLLRRVRYKLDINTLHKNEENTTLCMNDVGRVQLRTSAPILHDPYRRNRTTGSFIVVDEFDHSTMAAGMIL